MFDAYESRFTASIKRNRYFRRAVWQKKSGRFIVKLLAQIMRMRLQMLRQRLGW